MILWINGKYINETEARISPFDHGYLYGLNYFENFRTYNGKVALLQEHYNRLVAKLNKFHINMPYSVTEIQQVIKELTVSVNNQDGVILLNVSAGDYDSRLQFQTIYSEPNVIVYRNELIPRDRGVEKSAKWLNIQEHYSPLENKFFGNLAVGSIENCEGFFLTNRGLITEGLKSTIFFVKDRILFTPSLTSGSTPSIMRQWVINTAKHLGCRVVEDVFVKQDLEDAYECFVANSVEELVPISNIENVQFLGRDGSIYQQLHLAYIEEILMTVKKGE